MQLTVIGCAGSFPGPDSPASCYLLEAEGFRLVLDLGNGSLGALQRHAGLFSVNAIALSHLHADHCVDIGAYWVVREYAPDGAQPPIPVFGPPGTAERVAGLGGDGGDAGGGVAAVQARFGFRDLAPGTFEVGPFRVTTDHVNHVVETFGFRIEYAGWCVTYSGDTGECDALVELARDADLMLCEASFVGEPDPDYPPNLHLTARQAAEHAARAGAGKLVLTHLVPWNDQDQTLAEASQAYHGPLSLAAPGRVLGPAGAS